MSLIQITNLTKNYHEGTDIELNVLKGIDLMIKEGEFVSIMGPSGSGKSTLMHLLGFLDSPSGGQYLFDGVETEKFDENKLAKIRNEQIGFVFQAFHLLPRTTAIENVSLPMIYAGSSEKSQKEKAKNALEAVGLGDRLNHTPNELSGGQQQRVSIARSLINDPKVIFADEPTGNLDSESTFEILAILEKLNKEGKTIIMVTHEEDIAEYTTRTIFLRDGAIEKDEKRVPKDAKKALEAFKNKKKE